jgi:hypothetical protein
MDDAGKVEQHGILRIIFGQKKKEKRNYGSPDRPD